MKEWFARLPKKDQRMLFIGAIALVIYAFVYLFLEIHDAHGRKNFQLNAAEQTLATIEQTAQNIQQYRSQGGKPVINASLANMAEASAKKSGFRLTRFQPDGSNNAQVWIDRVEFNKVLEFVSILELTYGAQVLNMTVNNAGDAGIVKARIKFSR